MRDSGPFYANAFFGDVIVVILDFEDKRKISQVFLYSASCIAEIEKLMRFSKYQVTLHFLNIR